MENYYYIDSEGKTRGPVARGELKRYGVTGTTKVWHEGMAQWEQALKVEELKADFTEDYNLRFMPGYAEKAQPAKAPECSAALAGGMSLPPTPEASNTASIYRLLKDNDVHSDLIPDKMNGFLLSLMAISAYVVTADRIVMASEEAFVHDFLQKHFGEEDTKEYYAAFQQLITAFKREGRQTLVPKIQKCCTHITNCFYDNREELALVTRYLQQLATSDNATSAEEAEAVAQLTQWLSIQ